MEDSFADLFEQTQNATPVMPRQNKGKPQPWTADPRTTLHLRIDEQERYIDPERLWWEQMVENGTRAIAKLGTLGIDTIHVAFLKKKIAALSKVTRWGAVPAAIQKAIDFDRPLSSSALVVLKQHYSAAKNPDLLRYLKEAGYETLLLSGLYEKPPGDSDIFSCCVSMSARDFRKEGFNVAILSNTTDCLVYDLRARQITHDEWDVKVLPPQEIYAGFSKHRPVASKQARCG